MANDRPFCSSARQPALAIHAAILKLQALQRDGNFKKFEEFQPDDFEGDLKAWLKQQESEFASKEAATEGEHKPHKGIVHHLIEILRLNLEQGL